MKKLLLSIFMILYITSTPVYSNPNYNPITNEIYCKNDDCIHEVGHLIDRNSGFISQSKEFREYFKDAKFYGINGVPRMRWPNEVTISTIRDAVFGWGGWSEFYAQNFWAYYGCKNMMPESMRKFYDFDMAYKELKKYGFDNEIICPIIKDITHGIPTTIL